MAITSLLDPEIERAKERIKDGPEKTRWRTQDFGIRTIWVFGEPGGEIRLASPATGEAVFAAIAERLKRRAGAR